MIDTISPPELRIEMFARHHAFDCGRCGDPWSYTFSEFWVQTLSTDPIDAQARIALVIVLTGAILKYKNDPKAVDGLKMLQSEILTANKSDEIISIVDRADAICFAASERV